MKFTITFEADPEAAAFLTRRAEHAHTENLEAAKHPEGSDPEAVVAAIIERAADIFAALKASAVGG